MNKIQQAYEQGLRIRYKGWLKLEWIKKHSETEVIDESGKVWEFGRLVKYSVATIQIYRISNKNVS